MSPAWIIWIKTKSSINLKSLVQRDTVLHQTGSYKYTRIDPDCNKIATNTPELLYIVGTRKKVISLGTCFQARPFSCSFFFSIQGFTCATTFFFYLTWMQTVCCCSGVGNQSIDSSIRIFKESTKKMKKFETFFFFFLLFFFLYRVVFHSLSIESNWWGRTYFDVSYIFLSSCKDLFSRSLDYFDS